MLCYACVKKILSYSTGPVCFALVIALQSPAVRTSEFIIGHDELTLLLSLLWNLHIFCFRSKVIVSLVFTCLVDAEGSFGTLTTDFPTASASAHFSALTQSLYQQSAHRASPTQGRPPTKGRAPPLLSAC